MSFYFFELMIRTKKERIAYTYAAKLETRIAAIWEKRCKDRFFYSLVAYKYNNEPVPFATILLCCPTQTSSPAPHIFHA